MDRQELRKKAIALRTKGLTYSEVSQALGVRIPKGTFSYWCSKAEFTDAVRKRIWTNARVHLQQAQQLAVEVNKQKRFKYLQSVRKRVIELPERLRDFDVAKIALAMLYLGEGSKNQRGSLCFGNSEPSVISLFLRLLRRCYNVDETKFRCTLQCRADQDIPRLERFWSDTTGIPLSQFYRARVDPRTIGRPSQKLDYKGVCRINYFSADIFVELLTCIDLIAGR